MHPVRRRFWRRIARLPPGLFRDIRRRLQHEGNVSMSPESKNPAPVTLTDDQATLVSGGALPTAVFRGGCPGCTSGLQLAFQSLTTNPVLPAQQQIQTFG